jgi:hypothetical protein
VDGIHGEKELGRVLLDELLVVTEFAKYLARGFVTQDEGEQKDGER